MAPPSKNKPLLKGQGSLAGWMDGGGMKAIPSASPESSGSKKNASNSSSSSAGSGKKKEVAKSPTPAKPEVKEVTEKVSWSWSSSRH